MELETLLRKRMNEIRKVVYAIKSYNNLPYRTPRGKFQEAVLKRAQMPLSRANRKLVTEVADKLGYSLKKVNGVNLYGR